MKHHGSPCIQAKHRKDKKNKLLQCTDPYIGQRNRGKNKVKKVAVRDPTAREEAELCAPPTLIATFWPRSQCESTVQMK